MKNEKKKFMTSREMKKAALHTLKHHYALLVMVCLLASASVPLVAHLLQHLTKCGLLSHLCLQHFRR